MLNPLRSLRFGAFVLASVGMLVLLAACQDVGTSLGGEGDTVAVTIAPTLASSGLTAQGIVSDLVISDVLVFVRDASTGDPTTIPETEPDCLVFASDGTVDDTVVDPTTDECAFSIWDGTSVLPRTLQLPPRDGAGDPIPYDFGLNVRSPVDGGLGLVITAAFASESIPELTTATTLPFTNLQSFLSAAFFRTYAPNDTAVCPPLDLEVEPGEVVPLFLFPFGDATGGDICFGGTASSTRSLIPFDDFGVGPTNVELDDSEAPSLLLDDSKRGVLLEVPSDAAPGQTIAVSVPVNGVQATFAADSDQNPDASLVDGTEFAGETASIELQVVEPPVGAGIAADLVAPVIGSVFTSAAVDTVSLVIGPTTDPADVADVVAYLGVQQVALEVTSKSTQTGAAGVVYNASICSDFARFIPTEGGTSLELMFYATDPSSNQTAPFVHPITINTSYPGPNSGCSSTSVL